MLERHFRDVQDALFWLTDCHIATYAYQASLKKTSHSELRRLRSVCRQAEQTCRQFGVPADRVAEVHRRRIDAKKIELEVHGVSDLDLEENEDVRGTAPEPT